MAGLIHGCPKPNWLQHESRFPDLQWLVDHQRSQFPDRRRRRITKTSGLGFFCSAEPLAHAETAASLEKAVEAVSRKVKLVIFRMDEAPQIAAGLGIQSSPAVTCFIGGRPVDGFMGDLPERQIFALIERLIGELPFPNAAIVAEQEPSTVAADDVTIAELMLFWIRCQIIKRSAFSWLWRSMIQGDARAPQIFYLLLCAATGPREMTAPGSN